MGHTVRAYAPGSIGNVGPGLDILGLAIASAGDEVELGWRDGATVIEEPGHPDLPDDPAAHTAAIAAHAVLRLAAIDRGLTIRVTKGLPLSGGQGGSAASAVAAAYAADALAGTRLDHPALLACALEAEATVAGRHLDNLAASLLGGLVLCRSLDPIDVIAIPVPESVTIVLAHPDQQLRTRESRAVLPTTVPLSLALEQAANIAAMVAGACLDDPALLGRSLDDRIAEPARAPLLPGFEAARRAALAAGALGCSISGAGPTAFALCDGHQRASEVAGAMAAAYAAQEIRATTTVTTPDRRGARLI